MRLSFLPAALLMLFSAVVFAQKPVVKPANTTPPKVVTGTVLLNEKTPLDAKSILAALKSDWKVKLDSTSINDKTIVFSAPGATVMIAYLNYPVAPAEIGAAAKISWIWPAAAAEAGRHQAQAVISIIGSKDKALDLYKLFTKVAAAVMENTRSAGVFMGTQYLLVPKGFYAAGAQNLLNNEILPLYCWVYFGMVQDKGMGSGYTFGLEEFGLTDMEIVKSKHNQAQVHATLYDAVATVLPYNTRLSEGQTFTTVEGQKMIARLSKGSYVEAQTWKLELITE